MEPGRSGKRRRCAGRDRGSERVHSFVNPPWGFVGCDSSRKAVVRLIREAKLLEIGGERAKRMKHALVVHAREGGCKFFATDMEKVEAMERRLAGTTAD